MAAIFHSLALVIVSEHCFEEYFYNGNVFDGACFKQSLSKSLGLALILGSILVKLPQILKLYVNKSSEGVNAYGVLLDLTGITIHMAYNYSNGFPFSAWGDALMLAIQTAIIAAMVFYYSSSQLKAILFLIFYGLVCALIICNVVPMKVLWTLQGCNIPVIMSGKLVQAFTNYKNGSTGQLSAATVFSLAAGSVARIFTSIQETGDYMMVLTFVASTAANLVLAGQMAYYWNVVAAPKKAKATKKQTKKQQ